MPATPIYALPYPAPSDPADGPGGFQALALRAEATLAPARVTALPGSPFDGQEVYFQSAAMATEGVVWHLRYRAAASGSYKWEFLGGPPMSTEIVIVEGTTSVTLVDLSTPGPTVTVPLAGDYLISFGATVASAGPELPWTTVKLGAAAVADAQGFPMVVTAGNANTGSRTERVAAIAASAALKMMYRTTAGGAVNWDRRWITVTPVRVG